VAEGRTNVSCKRKDARSEAAGLKVWQFCKATELPRQCHAGKYAFDGELVESGHGLRNSDGVGS
jgi:hypothetical protein